MPWYKSGTVAITAGQTSVVGTNTDFAANARVGDAFQGPDGRWYEVANIASATVLSILPAYQGATVSAGGYGLAPMQGYVKESADALRALVNQFGAKLAALGTTGNYDVLPVTKGGTGGANPADARSGLGLGAVSVESIVPVEKGGTGSTTASGARAALGVIGRSGATTTTGARFVSTAAPAIAQFDWIDAAALTIGNGGSNLSSAVISFSRDGQFSCHLGIDTDNVFKIGGWSFGGVAYKIYHEGNTTRAADGTLKAV